VECGRRSAAHNGDPRVTIDVEEKYTQGVEEEILSLEKTEESTLRCCRLGSIRFMPERGFLPRDHGLAVPGGKFRNTRTKSANLGNDVSDDR